MAQLIQQSITLDNANPVFEFNGSLTQNLTDMAVSLTRLASETPFPPGEVREITAGLLLSTDGGNTFVDQGGIDWVDGVENSQEPSGTTAYVIVAKSPNRRIRVNVTRVRGGTINLLATVTAL